MQQKIYRRKNKVADRKKTQNAREIRNKTMEGLADTEKEK